jgi:hypothetical protein
MNEKGLYCKCLTLNRGWPACARRSATMERLAAKMETGYAFTGAARLTSHQANGPFAARWVGAARTARDARDRRNREEIGVDAVRIECIGIGPLNLSSFWINMEPGFLADRQPLFSSAHPPFSSTYSSCSLSSRSWSCLPERSFPS